MSLWAPELERAVRGCSINCSAVWKIGCQKLDGVRWSSYRAHARHGRFLLHKAKERQKAVLLGFYKGCPVWQFSIFWPPPPAFWIHSFFAAYSTLWSIICLALGLPYFKRRLRQTSWSKQKMWLLFEHFLLQHLLSKYEGLLCNETMSITQTAVKTVMTYMLSIVHRC